MLPNSPANDPDLLEGLSQAELHALSVVMLSPEQQQHLSALLERNRQQTLTPDEEDELDRLLKRIQHAFGLIEEAEQAAVKRLREVWPELSETEARRIYRSGEDDD
jgi:hypothetical protein